MRFILIGTVAFTHRCLESSVAAGADIVAVLTLRREDALFHSDYVDLGPTAARLGIPVYRIVDVNAPDTIELIRTLRPDAIFVFGWSQLLGKELLSLAPCIGSHPALLPRDRGRHPITWALVEGATESGLTFMWLDEGADSGDILWQRAFRIGPDDDAQDVYSRIESLAVEAIHEFVPQLIAGNAPRIPQDERFATYRRRRTDEDRRIDWRQTRREVHDLVRGLARPYVGAIARIDDQDIRIWKTRIADRELPDVPVGGVVATDRGGVAVRAGDGFLEVIESEPTGILVPGVRMEVAPE